MPYRVTCAEDTSISVLRSLSTVKDEDGKVLGYDHESVSYHNGDVIEDDDVSPAVVTLYDAGDAHTTSILKREARKGRPPKAAVVEETPDTEDDEAESPLAAQMSRRVGPKAAE
jgi:hypothetical protein